MHLKGSEIVIKMNKKMEDIIDYFNMDGELNYNSPNLIELINPCFIEIGDCILRKETNNKIEELPTGTNNDRTGFEASYSHIHMIDYEEDFPLKTFEGFYFFLKLVGKWSRCLKDSFPNYEFHIILTFDSKDCTLRFHKLRNNELPWVDIDNLNDFKEVAILVNIV